MAMNHIATVRSSSRAAHQKALESNQETTSQEVHSLSIQTSDPLLNELSQMSIISLNSGGGDIPPGSQHRKHSQASASFGESSKSLSRSTTLVPKLVSVPLDPLDTLTDIEACVGDKLAQLNVLNTLEQKWAAITTNIEEVLSHLRECSDTVTEASMGCLEGLVKSIDLTCDEADREMKALYHLITKCDELTTKLSAASSFRDEVKTLRKSIETLDNLYKTRTQSNYPRQSLQP